MVKLVIPSMSVLFDFEATGSSILYDHEFINLPSIAEAKKLLKKIAEDNNLLVATDEMKAFKGKTKILFIEDKPKAGPYNPLDGFTDIDELGPLDDL